MFPIKDNNPSKTFPFVNWLIILSNIIVFIYELRLGEKATMLFDDFALTPSKIPAINLDTILSPQITIYATFLTNTFLHGGFGHLIGNMWTLFIFGDNVEDRMGHSRYLLFYLLSGIIASFTHFYLYQDSTVPAIGASGAISAIMGAYMFLFPKAKIIFFIPIFFIIPLFIPIPAFIYLAFWFLGQFYNGTLTYYMGESSTGIAFWAHIGGFISGAILFRLFLKPKRKKEKIYY